MNRTLGSAFFSIVMFATTAGLAKADHLLISEVVLTPEDGEFVEIANPTHSPVDLSNCYLADHGSYWRIVNCTHVLATNDFFARFPAGATVAARSAVVVSIAGNAKFAATYGKNADFELVQTDETPNMLPACPGSIGSLASLINAGECVILFYWDGQSDLVKDLDMVEVGQPAPVSNSYMQNVKGQQAIDGPDADALASTYPAESFLMTAMPRSPASGESAKRPDATEGSERGGAGGAGLTGDDETSENTHQTWLISSPPTPGTAVNVAPVSLSAFAAE